MGCGNSSAADAGAPASAGSSSMVGVTCGKCSAPFSITIAGGGDSTGKCPSCGALNKVSGVSPVGVVSTGSDTLCIKIPTGEAVKPPTGSGGLPSHLSKSKSSMKHSKSGMIGGKTKEILEIQLTGAVRRPCKYGLGCYRKQAEHLDEFSHPDDDDYPLAVRKHKGKGEFLSMKDCFRYMDPFNKGIIDDKSLLSELMEHLEKPLSQTQLEEVWATLDDDGNGYASFSEFIEWAKGFGIDLPVGIQNPIEDAGPQLHLGCTFPGCACYNFRGTGRICKCGHKRGLHLAANDDIQAQVPENWAHQDSKENVSQWVECGDAELQHVQIMMTASSRQVWTRDRGRDAAGAQKKVPSGFEVVKVQRNENTKIWRKYALKRHLIKENLQEENAAGEVEHIVVKTSSDHTGEFPSLTAGLDKTINEWYLWHGTSVAGAQQICEVDFKQRYAGSVTGTLYGPGTYFADSCTKSDEYAGTVPQGDEDDPSNPVFICLLCRVVGGLVNYNEEVEPNAEELTNSCLHEKYDSVLGDREKCRNTFKEFVIFGSDQAYPEYIVHYRRLWS